MSARSLRPHFAVAGVAFALVASPTPSWADRTGYVRDDGLSSNRADEPSGVGAFRVHGELGAGHFLAFNGAWQGREIGFGAIYGLGLELGLGRRLGFEARLLGGQFAAGSAPTDPSIKPVGQTFLFGGGLGFRYRFLDDLRGPWIGATFGAVATGDVARWTAEARVGWDFRLGNAWALGPYAGYVQVFQPTGSFRPQDGQAVSLGLHLAFDEGPPRPSFTVSVAPPPAPPKPRTCGSSPMDPRFGDRDGCQDPVSAGTLRLPDRCPDEPEAFVGGADEDGCPDANAEVRVVGDEILLNDRVYFDFAKARVKHASHPLLKSLAKLILAHPEYVVVHIDGHTDEIGDNARNQKLSEERAAAVRAMLVEFGVPEERLQSRGFGKTKPRAKGRDDNARQENRRVEFLIERRVGGTER
jgi:outer membrane protein OmpA-like peptidoglycan-associated protein